MTRCVGSEAEPSIPIAFALSMRPQPPMSAVLSIDGPLSRAELSTEWYVPTAGAWYEARAGRVPAPPAPITARAYTLEARVAGEVAKEVVDIDDDKELDERLQRLQTTEEEEGAREGASDRSDEDSSDGWETVSEER